MKKVVCPLCSEVKCVKSVEALDDSHAGKLSLHLTTTRGSYRRFNDELVKPVS